jgi:hypothetical protein
MSKLDDLTIGEAKEISTLVRGGTLGAGKSHSLKVGENYFVQTVTAFYTGKLVAVTESDFELSEAAWIASTGRFSDALKSGVFDEVEPFSQNAIVSRGVILCITPWPHALPRVQK